MWGEVCIFEAVNHYRATLSVEENNTERAKWASVITSILQGVLACIDEGGLEVGMYMLEYSSHINFQYINLQFEK